MKQHTFTFRCFPPQSTKSEVFLFTKLKARFMFMKYINCISEVFMGTTTKVIKDRPRCSASFPSQSTHNSQLKCASLAFINPQYVNTREAKIYPPKHP